MKIQQPREPETTTQVHFLFESANILSKKPALGHYYYSTGDVASFQGFFLKQKRVERDETYHKCGSRTQLSLTKHWIRQKLRQQASKLIVIFLSALKLS